MSHENPLSWYFQSPTKNDRHANLLIWDLMDREVSLNPALFSFKTLSICTSSLSKVHVPSVLELRDFRLPTDLCMAHPESNFHCTLHQWCKRYHILSFISSPNHLGSKWSTVLSSCSACGLQILFNFSFEEFPLSFFFLAIIIFSFFFSLSLWLA